LRSGSSPAAPARCALYAYGRSSSIRARFRMDVQRVTRLSPSSADMRAALVRDFDRFAINPAY